MSPHTDRTSVSYDDYLKLKGLFALAAEHNRALDTINRAAASITGETHDLGDDYFGHTSDEMSEREPSADRLLEKLSLAIDPPTGRPA